MLNYHSVIFFRDWCIGATTSFMLFSNTNRAAMKAENPDLPVTELSKLLGAKWREMSKEEKEPYEDRAKEDKQR